MIAEYKYLIITTSLGAHALLIEGRGKTVLMCSNQHASRLLDEPLKTGAADSLGRESAAYR